MAEHSMQSYLTAVGFLWQRRLCLTQLLAMVLLQDRRLDLNNLKKLLVELEIPFNENVRLYNSGNYAYLNTAVFLKLKNIAVSRK